MTVMSSMNETALAPGTGGLALNYLVSSVSLRCSKVGLDCILAVLPALTQPLPNLHHLEQIGVWGVPVRTCLMRRGPLREQFPLARAGTCGGIYC